jgi:hypothetical protein
MADAVVVQRMSAPATASFAEPTGSIETPASPDSARRTRAPPRGECSHTRTLRSFRSGPHRVEMRLGLNAGAQDREISGILAGEHARGQPRDCRGADLVIELASMTASKLPFSVSNSSTAPWCESRSVPWFAGSMR